MCEQNFAVVAAQGGVSLTTLNTVSWLVPWIPACGSSCPPTGHKINLRVDEMIKGRGKKKTQSSNRPTESCVLRVSSNFSSLCNNG